MIRKLIASLSHSELYFLLLVVFLFVLLRIPSLIEPNWYGDEGIYEVIGVALNHGRVLYRDIWDNKPPVLYLIYALFQANLLWIKLTSLIFGVTTVVIFFFLSKIVLVRRFAIFFATTLFALLFGLPLLEGNIANAENFMLLFIAAAFLVGLKTKYWYGYFLSGLLLSFAIMTKIVAVFDSLALISILFFMSETHALSVKNVIKILKNKLFASMLIGIGTLPLIFFIYFSYNDALLSFLRASFTSNVGYVGYENYFFIPLGGVIIKALLLGCAFIVIFSLRKRLSFHEQCILTWMAFSLFSIFFSDRPYIHYILMGLMPFCLLLGLGIGTRKIALPALLLSVLIGIVVYIHFPLYLKNVRYYQNFISFVFGKKEFLAYADFFDANTVRDYKLAAFLNHMQQKDSNIFFWSDSGQLYILTGTLPPGKYIVGYHILSYPGARGDTKKALDTVLPQFIVSTKQEEIPQEFLTQYQLKYTLERTRIYERRI